MKTKTNKRLTQKEILELAHQYNNSKREMLKTCLRMTDFSAGCTKDDLRSISMNLIYTNHLIDEMLNILNKVPLDKIKNYRIGSENGI